MRNLTVSVDDDVYRHCRIRAAELDTSVSALVRAFLRRLVSDTGREPTVPAREGERLLEFRRGELDEVPADLDARCVGLRSCDILTRGKLYDRDHTGAESVQN